MKFPPILPPIISSTIDSSSKSTPKPYESKDPQQRSNEYYSLSHMNNNQEKMKTLSLQLSRLAMRAPNQKLLDQAAIIHRNLSQHFATLSDEGLKWLLGATNKYSHGGFKDVAHLKKFLTTSPSEMKSQKLFTQLETISSAIGYRYVGAHMGEKPYSPNTSHELQVHSVLKKIMGNKLVTNIETSFPERDSDSVKKKNYTEDIIEISPGYISEATDDEENIPQKPSKNRYFRAEVTPGKKSIMGKANESNIPIRNHVSGTTPLCLAALEGLLIGDNSQQNLDENEVQSLGAMLMSCNARADFHSLIEVQAGIEHYNLQRQKTYLDPSSHSHTRSITAQKALSQNPEYLFQRAVQTIKCGTDYKNVEIREVAETIEATINNLLPSSDLITINYNKIKDMTAQQIDTLINKRDIVLNNIRATNLELNKLDLININHSLGLNEDNEIKLNRKDIIASLESVSKDIEIESQQPINSLIKQLKAADLCEEFNNGATLVIHAMERDKMKGKTLESLDKNWNHVKHNFERFKKGITKNNENLYDTRVSISCSSIDKTHAPIFQDFPSLIIFKDKSLDYQDAYAVNGTTGNNPTFFSPRFIHDKGSNINYVVQDKIAKDGMNTYVNKAYTTGMTHH